MTNIFEWFSTLITLSGFGYFVAGFGFAFISRWVYCTVKRERLRIPWYYVGITIGVFAILITTIQSSTAYNTAKETAQEVQNCQREFNSALQARSKITAENDELSQNQRLILFNWLHDLIFPPAPFDSMQSNDPRRQKYGLNLTFDTERKFRASLNRQDELQAWRDHHPLPDPSCGN